MSTIQGEVTDQDDNPIADVAVVLLNTTDSNVANWTIAATATTDSAGEYSFGGLNETDEYHVVIQYETAEGELFNSESKPFLEPTDDPFYDVIITDDNSPVEAGQTAEIDYRVENTGTETGEQDIVLAIDGTQADADTNIQIDPGNSSTGTLEWDTEAEDGGDDYTATVSSDDDSDSTTITVGDVDTFFEITFDASNSPINHGETLVVDYTITNVGPDTGTQTIELNIDGIRDSEEQTLGPNEQESSQLTWGTVLGDNGEYLAIVASENDSDSGVVTVQGDFDDVTITDTRFV